jgi:hypothetical protein
MACIAVLFALGACQAGVKPPASTAVPPSAAPTVKPLGEHVAAEWSVSAPAGIFIGVDSVWVPGHGSASTTRIDPVSNMVIGTVRNDAAEHASAAEGFGSRWIPTLDNELTRVDTVTAAITTIRFADGSQDILNDVLLTATAVWVVHPDAKEWIEIDPATNRIASRIPWTTLIDEARKQTTVPSGTGTDFIWLNIAGDEGGGGIPKGLLRLDPETLAGLTFLPWAPDQNGDGSLAITDDAVWYGAGGHIYRINVATNRIDATYTTALGTIHTAVGFGSVWLTNYERGLVQRLDVAP